MQFDVQPEQLKDLFQQNLLRIRKERGLTQAALVSKLNQLRKRHRKAGLVHTPYISALESGERSPTLETIAELSEALGVEPDALISVPQTV